MASNLVLLLVAQLIVACLSSSCANPPPAAHFDILRYNGVWYELGKYQTLGGAIFEHGCKCTKIEIGQKDNVITAVQSCMQNGKNTTVNAVLVPDPLNPGKFDEKIFTNSVGYWVIYLDDDHAIEYDCKTSALGETNYCVHLMSRKPMGTAEEIKMLSDYALSLGLNKNNLNLQITEQNCWNMGYLGLRTE